MKYTSFFILFFSFSSLFGLNDVMKVKLSGNSYSDETVIRFLPGATQGFDSQWDAHKFFSLNPNVPQIFTRSNITDLAINALPPLLRDTVVELRMIIPVAGTYSIQGIEAGAFQQGVSVILEELSTGNVYDLRSGNIFYFTMDTAGLNSAIRFVVRFYAPVITSFDSIIFEDDIAIQWNEVSLSIIAHTSGKRVVKIYDVSGKLYRSILFHEPHATIDLMGYAKGTYVVNVESEGSILIKKILLR